MKKEDLVWIVGTELGIAIPMILAFPIATPIPWLLFGAVSIVYLALLASFGSGGVLEMAVFGILLSITVSLIAATVEQHLAGRTLTRSAPNAAAPAQ